MNLDKHIVRTAKIIAEREGIIFAEAQAKLKSLTLEISVGSGADTPAAQTAILTAVNLAHRSFLGGVRLSGQIDSPLCTALPISAVNLAEAAKKVGTSDFSGQPLQKLLIGEHPLQDDSSSISLGWEGWSASASSYAPPEQGKGANPLVGIAAAALGVGLAFSRACGWPSDDELQINLWSGAIVPKFEEVFLPDAAWLIGLGNLGQAYVWALSSLPYVDPKLVHLVFQDKDRIKKENWATSALVFDESQPLKTKLCESWAVSKGFNVYRVDRFFTGSEVVLPDEPQVALSGLDSTSARRLLGQANFKCIVDAGLGATSGDFDRLRVNTFSGHHNLEDHFKGVDDIDPAEGLSDTAPYKDLNEKIGQCGMVEIAGASAAVPYVSALAAAIAVTNMIAIASGLAHSWSQAGRISKINTIRRMEPKLLGVRGVGHAGRPRVPQM